MASIVLPPIYSKNNKVKEREKKIKPREEKNDQIWCVSFSSDYKLFILCNIQLKAKPHMVYSRFDDFFFNSSFNDTEVGSIYLKLDFLLT